MSASLVGSEMCIRDRPPPSAPKNEILAPEALAKRAPPVPASGRRGFDAVSYTHLTLPTICSV
eukprot:9105497-Alexandrium_andersonii.AAC.1